jgi:putative tryptophan/tyrosine transport system substrate-binding protein
MFNPDTSPQSQFFVRSIESAASSLDVQSIVVPVRANADIESAMETFARGPGNGLILTTDSFTNSRQKPIADLAIRYRLPAIGSQPDFAKGGGLMSYGIIVNTFDQFGQAAGYIDRILKGAKPADLPVQGADKYRLILNMVTAKALGLSVPPTLLARADEVIE